MAHNNNSEHVQIDGMELLRESSREETPPNNLDIEVESDSYANDSLELAKRFRQTRKDRRLSMDSFANDSVKLTRKNQKLRRNGSSSSSIGQQQQQIDDDALPLEIEEKAGDVKSTPQPVATPDLSSLRPVRITNRAA